MGIFSKPKIPDPVIIEEPEPLPTEADEEVVDSRKKERRRAATARGRGSTLLGSPLGVTSDALTTGSLLG